MAIRQMHARYTNTAMTMPAMAAPLSPWHDPWTATNHDTIKAQNDRLPPPISRSRIVSNRSSSMVRNVHCSWQHRRTSNTYKHCLTLARGSDLVRSCSLAASHGSAAVRAVHDGTAAFKHTALPRHLSVTTCACNHSQPAHASARTHRKHVGGRAVDGHRADDHVAATAHVAQRQQSVVVERGGVRQIGNAFGLAEKHAQKKFRREAGKKKNLDVD